MLTSTNKVFRPRFWPSVIIFLLGSGLIFLALHWTITGVRFLSRGMPSEILSIFFVLFGISFIYQSIHGFTEVSLEKSRMCIKRLPSSKQVIPYEDIQGVVITRKNTGWGLGATGISITIKHSQGYSTLDFILIERKECTELLEEIEKHTGKQIDYTILNQ